MRNPWQRCFLLYLGVVLFLGRCNKITDVFQAESPREKYAHGLEKSPLAHNGIVKTWQQTADSVLDKPVAVDLPFQTKIVYFSDEAHAWAWQVPLPQGRTLHAHVAQTDTAQQVFLDLFSVDGGRPTLKKSLQDSILSYTANESQSLIIRVQAELLVNGSATLTFTDNPSMEFPVQNGIRADIGSFWGDPRDGGRRQHKGVDIFAERGTPVLATADGWITRTGNRGLGGKQVWLRANGKSMYYAHLDSISSHPGQKVSRGDTLGFVGNSGNARTTPTHLHFGIYDHGAINPLPFIDFANITAEPVSADPKMFAKWGRIASGKANVRPLPSTKQSPIATLSQNNPVQIIGGIGEWYRVKLPDGRPGFIYKNLLELPERPVGTAAISAGDALYHSFSSTLGFLKADSARSVDYFAAYQNRRLTKFESRWIWVKH